jgi:hypothetical protein
MTAGQSDEASDEKMGAYDLIRVFALETGRSARAKAEPSTKARALPAR